MSRFAGLRLAVGLLTIIPVRPPETIGRREARAAMLLAPLAVLPVALAAGLVGWGSAAAGVPPVLAGLVTVAVLAFGTRAMHLDGLADTTDGLGSGTAADRALEIMRRGDIGPMGTVALILALALQAVAAGALLERPFGWLQLVVLVCLSRAALLFGCLHGVPAARPDGLGALVAGSIGVTGAVVTWLLGLAAAIVVAVLAGQALWAPAIGVVLAVAACLWLVLRCVRRLGGVTGDVLGALVEVGATVLLVTATAWPPGR
ncbi:MAG TPA: adenosylcobinamide-GDP ribazoletransferase [Propionicimonas sp.]|uniref:adenosylcobinamide-GDP ribazoletransferase n=1 Tax=Propionicimonas sp. TaxID=1955623 RepID=UPI002F4017B3